MKFLASNHDDLHCLVDFIRRSNRTLQKEILAIAIYHKMMLTDGAWYIRLLFKILLVTRGYNGIRNLVYNIDSRTPDVIDEWIVNLSDHILWGEDLDDEDSVGGFSQKELDLMMTNLHSFVCK